MKPRTLAAAALVLATVALPARGQQEGGVLSLSLEECILRAMKNNLSVAIQVLNPEICGAAVTMAGEKFYPSLSLGLNKRNTDSASYSWLDAAGSVVTRMNDYTLDFSQTVPGGGAVGLSLNSNKNDTNRSFQTINPRYGSTPDVRLHPAPAQGLRLEHQPAGDPHRPEQPVHLGERT